MQGYITGLLFLSLAVLGWSTHSSLIVEFLNETDMSPFIFLFLRPLIGGISLLIASLVFRVRHFPIFHRLALPGLFLAMNFALIQWGVIECGNGGVSGSPMLLESSGASVLILVCNIFSGNRKSTILAWMTVLAVSCAVLLSLITLHNVGISLMGMTLSVCCAVSWFLFSISIKAVANEEQLSGIELIRSMLARTAALLLWTSLFCSFLVISPIWNYPGGLLHFLSSLLDARFMWITIYSTGACYVFFSIAIGSRLGADGCALGLSLTAIATLVAGAHLIQDYLDANLILAASLCVLGNILNFFDCSNIPLRTVLMKNVSFNRSQ